MLCRTSVVLGSLASLVLGLATAGCMGGGDSSGAAGSSASGSAGTTGAAGTAAAAGTTGAAGTAAAAGTTGAAGTSAAAGTTGAAGTSAAAGTSGAAGTSAAAGTTGAAGTGSGAGTTGTAGTTAGGGRGGGVAGSAGTSGGAGTTGSAGASGGAFTLSSPDLMDGAKFGTMFTCAMTGAFGSGLIPKLDWSGVPAGTMSFAITFIDTTIGENMSMGQHWAIWNIPWNASTGKVSTIPQGTKALTGDLMTAKQNGNYLAPCAQSLKNNMDDQYEFTIYALSSATLNVTGGTSVMAALTALRAVTPLGTAKLHGHAGLMGK